MSVVKNAQNVKTTTILSFGLTGVFQISAPYVKHTVHLIIMSEI